LDQCNSKPGCSWKFYAQQRDASSPNGPYIWNTCTYAADCLDTTQDANDVPQTQIIADARAGTLPSISYVTPALDAHGNDDSGHNNQSLAVEDTNIGRIVDAIESGPDWGSTAIFITWDDCGCFFDHVTPPAGLGNRLPLIMVSPYARPSYTDRRTATQYSILAYIEHTFGLAPLTSHDANAYDLSAAFNYSQVPLRTIPMVARMMPSGEHPEPGLRADDDGT
jgi:phospholipase C